MNTTANLKPGRTRALVESALLIAIAFVLSFITLFEMPFGGRVTLVSMLPLILLGLKYGPVWSFPACLAYSILQFIQEPYFLHPFQFFLDYLLGFGILGLAGLFRGKKHGFYFATVACLVGRFLASFFSGVIYWNYAADWGLSSAYLYSFLYNGAYMLPELVLTLVVGTALLKSRLFKLLEAE
ncbi:energy-coupled thiamine transporter ThiT [Oscillospiraceae bacterium OttesenSCG-928-G22]|nr:energy-coupled thiamine transporter ThiT [Oscillospiraceae bacterium OttesenSCG-928-G22]